MTIGIIIIATGTLQVRVKVRIRVVRVRTIGIIIIATGTLQVIRARVIVRVRVRVRTIGIIIIVTGTLQVISVRVRNRVVRVRSRVWSPRPARPPRIDRDGAALLEVAQVHRAVAHAVQRDDGVPAVVQQPADHPVLALGHRQAHLLRVRARVS